MKVTIAVDGLSCGDTFNIERRLNALSGVEQAYVNPLTEMAYVAFNPCLCRVDEIRAAIRDLGFRPGEPRAHSRM